LIDCLLVWAVGPIQQGADVEEMRAESRTDFTCPKRIVARDFVSGRNKMRRRD
jgi:hypothetical protein